MDKHDNDIFGRYQSVYKSNDLLTEKEDGGYISRAGRWIKSNVPGRIGRKATGSAKMWERINTSWDQIREELRDDNPTGERFLGWFNRKYAADAEKQPKLKGFVPIENETLKDKISPSNTYSWKELKPIFDAAMEEAFNKQATGASPGGTPPPPPPPPVGDEDEDEDEDEDVPPPPPPVEDEDEDEEEADLPPVLDGPESPEGEPVPPVLDVPESPEGEPVPPVLEPAVTPADDTATATDTDTPAAEEIPNPDPSSKLSQGTLWPQKQSGELNFDDEKGKNLDDTASLFSVLPNEDPDTLQDPSGRPISSVGDPAGREGEGGYGPTDQALADIGKIGAEKPTKRKPLTRQQKDRKNELARARRAAATAAQATTTAGVAADEIKADAQAGIDTANDNAIASSEEGLAAARTNIQSDPNTSQVDVANQNEPAGGTQPAAPFRGSNFPPGTPQQKQHDKMVSKANENPEDDKQRIATAQGWEVGPDGKHWVYGNNKLTLSRNIKPGTVVPGQQVREAFRLYFSSTSDGQPILEDLNKFDNLINYLDKISK